MATHEVFPYLCVHDVRKALDFYARAFGAAEKFRLVEPSGKIGHAEMDLGGYTVMLAEEYPEYGFERPDEGRSRAFAIHIHVDDADEVIERAVAAGASLVRPPSDAFYGERSGKVRDPFGHEWLIGHNFEEVSPDEMQRRYTALFDGAK